MKDQIHFNDSMNSSSKFGFINKLSLLGFIILSPLVGQAHNSYHGYHVHHRHDHYYHGPEYCIQVDYIQMPSKVESLGECQEKTPQYKNGDSSSRGRSYWVGGFDKNVIIKNQQIKVTTNICSHETISSEPVEFVQTEVKDFKIYNSNLQNNLKHSWEELPLTQDQALLEFEKARKNCLDYDLNSALCEFEKENSANCP